MKANRKYLRDSDDGASVIVGAILLFALTFLVLVMIQSNFVPVWEQDAEAAHSQAVRSQLTFLKSQMERQIEEGITNPVSSPVDTDRNAANRIFSNQYVPPGILSMDRVNPTRFNLTSPELSVATVTDPDFVGAGETWDTVDGDRLEDVSRFASLRVRFGVDAQPYKTQWAYLEAEDVNGNLVGRMAINLLQMSTNGNGVNQAEFWIDVEDAQGNQLGAQYFEANNQQVPSGSEPPYAWINALHPDYRFDRLLGSAEGPLTLTLTTTGGLPADFSAAYYQQTEGGGDVLVGGGSTTITNYESTAVGERLVYDALPQYYVDQDMVLEYGALLLTQGDAASIISAPSLAVGTSSTRTSMSWTIPHLNSNPDAPSTSTTGLVITTATNQQILTATGQVVTIELATEYSDAWNNHFTSIFERAGLTEGNEYAITTTSDSISLTLNGPSSGTDLDVSLSIQSATMEVLL